MDTITYTCNVSKIFHDSIEHFSNGYNDCADLLISSLFAKQGLYDINKQFTTPYVLDKFIEDRSNFQSSYIWSDVHEISDLLRYSFIYTTIHRSASHINYMNDAPFNNIIKEFKKTIISYIQEYSLFLAYCDLESCGLFLYTDSRQVFPKEKFLDLYRQSTHDLNIIFKRFQGKIPKVVLSIIYNLRVLLDVRETHGETLIQEASMKNMNKLVPTFDRNIFDEIVLKIKECNLTELHNYLETLYNNLALLHVVSSIDWIITMQGTSMCKACSITLDEYMTTERLQYLNCVQDIFHFQDMSIMKHELFHMNFIKRAFKVVNDVELLENYAINHVGAYGQLVIANSTKLYLKNINLIVYADLLFVGYYDVIDKQYLPKHDVIEDIIIKAEKDLKECQNTLCLDIFMIRIMMRTTHAFRQSLKKLKRFHKWLKHIQCDDINEANEIRQGIEFIFGDVYDSDNQPTICPICLDNSEERKDTWYRLTCGHGLHLECCNQLLSSDNFICPMCREKVI